MPRGPSRRPGRNGRRRRSVLAAVATGVAGLGLGLNVVQPSAYTSASAGRESNVAIAGDTNGAFLGLLVSDSVQKNKQSLLVEVTNNAGRQLSMTVSLDDPSQGTLYVPNDSGSSVQLTLDASNSGSVEVETSESKGTTVPFSITHDGAAMQFDVNRETTVESGNTDGEVAIDELTRFKAASKADEWTIKTLRASSTKYDLDEVELVVEEDGSGSVVAERTYANIDGTEFSRDGTGSNPGVVLQPDDGGYDVSNQKTYVLTVTATDTDGNFARDTATA